MHFKEGRNLLYFHLILKYSFQIEIFIKKIELHKTPDFEVIFSHFALGLAIVACFGQKNHFHIEQL
jgi:hypothetical protein